MVWSLVRPERRSDVDGIHDMGGTQGWGTVTIDPDEPVFAEPWEGKEIGRAHV